LAVSLRYQADEGSDWYYLAFVQASSVVSGAGTLDNAATFLEIANEGNWGADVGIRGDVDGDGLADVLVHEPNESCDDSGGLGCLRVYLGSSLAVGTYISEVDVDFELGRSADATTQGAFTSADLIPDADGDGLDDILAETQGYHGYSDPYDGRLGILSSSALAAVDTWNEAAALSIIGDSQLEFDYLAGSGDFDGDGRVDLAVPAQVWPEDVDRDATAMIFVSGSLLAGTGSFALLDAASAVYWSESASPGSEFLNVPAIATDLDGDGCDDLASLPEWPYWAGVWSGAELGG
jgi:hypothetical protein